MKECSLLEIGTNPFTTKYLSQEIKWYDTKDYEKDGLYRRCLISRVEYNLPCSNYMNESRLDDWEAMQIKGILDAEINTNNKVEIKIGEGETSLTK